MKEHLRKLNEAARKCKIIFKIYLLTLFEKYAKNNKVLESRITGKTSHTILNYGRIIEDAVKEWTCF